MTKVTREVAEQEAQRFIESLNIKPRKLEKLEEEKEEFINAIMYGNITVKESGECTYILDDPIEYKDGEKALTQIEFKSRRVSVGEMEKRMFGKTDMEKTRRILAFLTSQNSAVFEKMQGDDFISLTNIAAFFLPR